MLKEFIKNCLEKAKEEYFETDHHYHFGKDGQDAEWNDLLKNMDRDFYEEWIDPVIYNEDKDIWFCADKFKLYMTVREVLGV